MADCSGGVPAGERWVLSLGDVRYWGVLIICERQPSILLCILLLNKNDIAWMKLSDRHCGMGGLRDYTLFRQGGATNNNISIN